MMNKSDVSPALKKLGVALGLVFASTTVLVACGGGDSELPIDPGTPTTLVTAVNGVRSSVCEKNAQCLDFTQPGPGTPPNPRPGFGIFAEIAATVTQAATPWTNTSTNIITISQIPFVDGAVDASYYDSEGSVFSTTSDNEFRYFLGNGLPSTKMGVFPVQRGTPAYSYYAALPAGRDPNGDPYSSPEQSNTADLIPISAYALVSKVPLNPQPTGFYPINSLIVGVTLTGAVWHVEYANDSSGNWYSPVNALPLDQCWGHPYSNQYHLHGYSWKCFPDQGTSGQSPVFGFALDGFPITGPRGADGQMITNAQLDKCHGMESEITMPDGTRKTTYHYVLNREYPYSVGCFRGKVNYIQALGSVAMRETNLPIYQDVAYPPGP
jgi:hypothetical protein